MFLDVSARSAELEVVVETIDHDHVERVIAALADVGLAARVGSVDVRPAVDLTGQRLERCELLDEGGAERGRWSRRRPRAPVT